MIITIKSHLDTTLPTEPITVTTGDKQLETPRTFTQYYANIDNYCGLFYIRLFMSDVDAEVI